MLSLRQLQKQICCVISSAQGINVEAASGGLNFTNYNGDTVFIPIAGTGGTGDITTLDFTQLSTQQSIDIINSLDFTQLSAQQISDVQSLLGITGNEVQSVTGVNVDNTDPQNPVVVLQTATQTTIDDTAGNFSSGNVEGALAEIAVSLSGITHTSITSIDLQPTGTPNEYTVVITWIDSNGVTQTTTDATPVVLAGAETITSLTSSVNTSDPQNPILTIDYTNEDGSQAPVNVTIPIPTSSSIVDSDGDSGISTVESGGANGGDRLDFSIDGTVVGSVEILAGGITKWTLDGILDPIVFAATPITTVQRDALSAQSGYLIFNSDSSTFEYYNGSSWSSLDLQAINVAFDNSKSLYTSTNVQDALDESDSRITDNTNNITTLQSSKLDASSVVDEDDMVSDSDVLVPTQQSVKAYVDNEISSIPTSNTGIESYTNDYVIGDWVDNTTEYTITVPQTTHTLGTNFTIQFIDLSTPTTATLTSIPTTINTTTGDIVLTIPNTTSPLPFRINLIKI